MPHQDPSQDELLQELFQAVLALDNLQECGDFFSDLFTRQELLSFSQRLQVAKLLLAGETYEMVRRQVSVSNSTSTRISTALQFGPGGYRTVLRRLAEQGTGEQA